MEEASWTLTDALKAAQAIEDTYRRSCRAAHRGVGPGTSRQNGGSQPDARQTPWRLLARSRIPIGELRCWVRWRQPWHKQAR